MGSRRIITILAILAVLALLATLVIWLVFPQWRYTLSAGLPLIITVLVVGLGAYKLITDVSEPRGWYSRGVAYAELGDYSQAIADYNPGSRTEPEICRGILQPWLLLRYAGRSYPSRRRLYPCARAEPEIPCAFCNRGASYFELGDHSQAFADYTRAIELDPKDTTAFRNRGLSYDELGEYSQAIADFSRAIELDPKDAATFYNRGLAIHEAGGL